MKHIELSEQQKREIRSNLRNANVESEKSALKAGAYDNAPEIKSIVEEWIFSRDKLSEIDRKDETLVLMREATQLAKEANRISNKANTRSLIALIISVSMLLISAITYIASR
jgi:hypothetical protein